jgi:CheY-like chemotaxis protein
VLVVDDDPLIRVALRAVLEDAGFTVVEAEHGVDALLQLSSGALMPSLIVLDLAMPGLDGTELLEALDEIPIAQRPPVVVLTAYLPMTTTVRTGAHGVRAVLSKPIRPDRFLKVVRFCLDNPSLPAGVETFESASERRPN